MHNLANTLNSSLPNLRLENTKLVVFPKWIKLIHKSFINHICSINIANHLTTIGVFFNAQVSLTYIDCARLGLDIYVTSIHIYIHLCNINDNTQLNDCLQQSPSVALMATQHVIIQRNFRATQTRIKFIISLVSFLFTSKNLPLSPQSLIYIFLPLTKWFLNFSL